MILAFDTSCYTTSVALIGFDGTIKADCRQVLQVKPGERGLQQSTAIFQHLGNLPRLLGSCRPSSLVAVAAATVPRPVEGSYLPVFKVAASFGESVARLAGVPFIETSHQEGHIRAGLYGQALNGDPFLAWHISGGTTELLYVTPKEAGFGIAKIGGSSDLHAGQFVDRVGVALGTPFPAGPHLEKLAMASSTERSLPVVTDGLTLSFSGPESAAQRLVGSVPPADLARQVFHCIGRSLWNVTRKAAEQYRVRQVLMVGGVASSRLVKAYLTEREAEADIRFAFARPELASDNAVGVGLIGYDRWKRGALE